jgi:hypothetical protein
MRENAGQDRSPLFDDIRRYYSLAEVPMPTQSAIDRLIAKGYKIGGIRGTLYYYFTVLENVPDKIELFYFIVTDNYDKAKAYVADCKAKKAAAEALPAEEKTRVVVIDQPKSSEPTFNYNMEDL